MTLTIRLPAPIKNTLIDQAFAYGLTMTDYLITLIQRDLDAVPAATSQP